jgi:hypothetical protein
MLTRVRRQAEELAADEPARGRLELIVLYDRDELPGDEVRRLVTGAIPEGDSALDLRVVGTGSGTYYELKYEGLRLAEGDVVVFVDSDVVPEEGWLRGLLDPFDDPEVQVVSGNSYIDPEGLVGKAFALFWFFPLRAEDGPLAAHRSFFFNNVAFRRSTLESRTLPRVDGATRGACDVLAEQLVDSGVTIWRNPVARVSHPAPNGVSHFVRRALAEGRDDVVRARESAGDPTLRGSYNRYRSHLRRARRRIREGSGAVGATGATGALVGALAAAYYTLYLAGEVATVAAPRRMASRLRI